MCRDRLRAKPSADPDTQDSHLDCRAFSSRSPRDTTTYIYLDHIATRADTVDAAVEELLALLPGPQGV